MKKIVRKIFGALLNFIFSFFKVDENKIVFESGRSKVDGNPKAIYNYIINNCPNEFKTVWLIDKKTDRYIIRPKDCFYYYTFKGYYHQATAKYWIKSQSISTPLKKRNGQIYIQVFHDSGAMKKCGYDVTGTKGACMSHASDWDYFIASDKPNADYMISSTGIDPKIVKMVGSAATDQIVNVTNEQKKKILDKLDITNNKKIILYVPTFRDSDLESDNINLPIFKLGELNDCLILVRLHPQLKNVLKKMYLPNNFVDVCDYPDIQDLILISDVFVGDYSSAVFTYSILEKPMVFYAYDYDLYTEERGFYLDYKKDLPGPIVYTEDELLNTLKNIDNINKDYKEKIKKFNKKYNKLNDGHVCQRLVDMIRNKEFK